MHAKLYGYRQCEFIFAYAHASWSLYHNYLVYSLNISLNSRIKIRPSLPKNYAARRVNPPAVNELKKWVIVISKYLKSIWKTII